MLCYFQKVAYEIHHNFTHTGYTHSRPCV